MDSRPTNNRLELVRPNKATDSFSISIPGKVELSGIPADFLPELRKQLELIGGWLSCWSYLYGSPLDDEERAKPEQELAWHTSECIEEIIKLLGYSQLKRIADQIGEEGAISEIVSKRIKALDMANAATPTMPQ